ncbi:hypothetical protein GXM_07881 [Nostoc sphaeroides CCNUC1]|uniref:Uncharacterized protein n=1 Tax=Nostoc sphaeroides CCNUC1 TaxID=2653204 RepID=A0A5P8WC45_9NOSO|nr:hypothetical protein GXM_07881 [Nostoc sphaeroides CCNUC1]
MGWGLGLYWTQARSVIISQLSTRYFFSKKISIVAPLLIYGEQKKSNNIHLSLWIYQWCD